MELNEALKNAAEKANTTAKMKAGKAMPKTDINELIRLITDVFTAHNKTEAAMKAAKILAKKYKKPAETYIKAFSVSFVEESLRNADLGSVTQEARDVLAHQIVKTGESIIKNIILYNKEEINEVELINRVCRSDVVELGKGILNASGVDFDSLKLQADKASVNLNIPGVDAAGSAMLMLSVYASVEACKILSQALKDAELAKEERIRIEHECAESICMMREYRQQMNLIVNEYLKKHADVFNYGLREMDRSILEGDINGFIRGNNQIQEILNYNIQFRNDKEFDDLMDSEEAFKL